MASPSNHETHYDRYRQNFLEKRVTMSMEEYLDAASKNPLRFLRDSSDYLLDAFAHFGTRGPDHAKLVQADRFKLFDLETKRSGAIIGGEHAQARIHDILKTFKRIGAPTQMILMHGPNGSAKSTTIDAISHALQLYSQSEEGAIYRFNWIFPLDREALPTGARESNAIGFGDPIPQTSSATSFALLEENKIAAKLSSEFKENPLFLVPTEFRRQMLAGWLSEDLIPRHILDTSLSKKNQLIFESLLNAYRGDISKVFRHVQVERFFFSQQYRVGISTIEPQMSIDATERQLTLDRNYSTLPSFLQTISLYQYEGHLVDANRGILEFSDLLKRPIEAFKYLLGTLEDNIVNLASGSMNLDITFFGTTNEKHLDAFKTIPDFSSFKGRFELVPSPYLLLPSLEEKIYAKDVENIKKAKKICPHTIRCLALWGTLTRLKQPDPEAYPAEIRPLISRLDPLSKTRVYEDEPLQPEFTLDEEKKLKAISEQIFRESKGVVVYEGRFGASPRELRSILHRAAGNNHKTLTPVAIFDELDLIVKDRTLYDFLQFEPRGRYHDSVYFIQQVKSDFHNRFKRELWNAMSLADDQEYLTLLRKYVENVVAQIKNEKIYDAKTKSYSQPSPVIMSRVEKILGVESNPEPHRQGLLSRIGAYRIDNPTKEIQIDLVFPDYLATIKDHFYQEKQQAVYANVQNILAEDPSGLRKEDQDLANQTLQNLNDKYGYDPDSAEACLKFFLSFQNPANS